MSDSVKTARGVVVNACALVSNFLIAFFLAPFVVNSLGSVRFGIWVVIGTLVSYMGLLDLGLKVAVTTYVARDHAVGNHSGASTIVSAALWSRQWVGLFLLGASLLIAALLEPVFQVPPELVSEARQAMMIYAVASVVSLVGGVYAAVLQAMNRLDIVAATTILQAITRAVGTVVLLPLGYALVALAVLEAAAALTASVLMVFGILRLYPQLRLSFSVPSRAVVTELGRYSGELVLWQLCARVITAGPSLIVGALLTPIAVTFYTVGGYLVNAVEQVRLTVTPAFIPLASRYYSAGNRLALQELLQRGTRLVLVLLLPILVGLFARGETFLHVWMGANYSTAAGGVLRPLSLGMILASAPTTAGAIILGLGRQREMLAWTGLQAVVTLILSIPLAWSFGIDGVAWGVAAASLIGLVQTHVACRLLGVPSIPHMLGSWGKPALAAVPFAIACLVTDHYWAATSVFGCLFQIAAVFPIYALSCMALMTSDLKLGWSMLRRPKSADVVEGFVA